MLSWLQKIQETRSRILIEDTLKHLHQNAWVETPSTPESVGGALGLSARKLSKLCRQMESRGLLNLSDGQLHITPTGEQLALQVVRAHRLWERYLVDEARVPLAKVHKMADRREHTRSDEQMSKLDASMGYPSTDPHGDPIPTAQGIVRRTKSTSLTHWPIDQSAIIVHLEDEPVDIFAQIVATGLSIGQRIKVIESNERRIVLTDQLQTHILAPIVAANVFLEESDHAKIQAPSEKLTTLQPGQSAKVQSLDNTLQGYTRRRLLDLGLTKGTHISAEYRSFLGDPIAYKVRGSLIALRRDQAEHVLISFDQSKEPPNV